MLNFDNVDNRQFTELKQVVQRSVEKSDLDRYYLFSTDKFIKAKLFILCYRFLLNAWNLTEKSGLKDELQRELEDLEPTYEEISYLLNFLDGGRKYGKHIVTEKLFYAVNEQEVSNLIDVFAILTERQNIISMSRFKGVIMEGKSGDEFNKIMRGDERRRREDGEEEEPEPIDAETYAEIEDKQEEFEDEVKAELTGEPLIKEQWKSPEDDSQEPEDALELDEEE